MTGNEQKLSVLKNYDFYNNSSDALKQKIAKAATHVNLGKGKNFFSKGESCGVIALVGKGRVRVYISGDTGREISLYRVEPGQTCPINLLAAVFNRPAPANAVVEEDIDAVVIPVNEFRHWLNEEEPVRTFVFDALINRFVNVMGLVEELTSRRLDQRLAQFLLSRFDDANDSPPKIRITHEQIAYELGSAREVISRLLGSFEQNGTVQLQRGAVTLLDPQYLQELTTMH